MEPELKLQTCRAIWNMCLNNDRNRYTFMEAVPKLIYLFNTNNVDLAVQACGALWAIAGQHFPYHSVALPVVNFFLHVLT